MASVLGENCECAPEGMIPIRQCRLFALPTDILLSCIATFLRKGDQYQWLSTCKGCNIMLLSTRTLKITCRISDMRIDKHLFNVYLWERFLKTDRQRLFAAVGISFPAKGKPNTNRYIRKIKLDISIDKLIDHYDLVLSIIMHLTHLNITPATDGCPNGPLADSLLKCFENPTELAVERWMFSSWLSLSDLDKTSLQIIYEFVETVNVGHEKRSREIAGWNELRGANKVIIKNDKSFFVELGADTDVSLQSVVVDHCNTFIDIPVVPSISILHCPNFVQVQTLSNAIYVHLEGMTIADLRRLGGVKQLKVKDCKVVHYPKPSIGKGQAWEFSNVDIMNVSELAILDQLALRDCTHVEDGSSLGSIQTLIIEGGNFEHYPVPKTGKGQHWTFSKVNIADVSEFTSLESLTLLNCQQVRDISMLGAVRYLTMERCENLLLSEQYPKPTGSLQEWTFKSMDMQKVCLTMFANLHGLTLDHCSLREISYMLTEEIFNNVKLFGSIIGYYTQNFNIYINGGKLELLDQLSLSKALYLWHYHKDIAMQVYGDIETWDVSKVKDMSTLFNQYPKFNDNINPWDVSNVTNMNYMFWWASSFNQPLESWDVANVTNMQGMFSHASSFNQSVDSWDVSNVTHMCWMFKNASSFNQPLQTWNMSNVTHINWMFYEATSFNQPLNSWDVGNVVDMCLMFFGASSFNQSLNSWDVSNVRSMSSMFCNIPSFKHLPSWHQ